MQTLKEQHKASFNTLKLAYTKKEERAVEEIERTVKND